MDTGTLIVPTPGDFPQFFLFAVLGFVFLALPLLTERHSGFQMGFGTRLGLAEQIL